MSMVNSCRFVGNLVDDSELRYMQDGTPIAVFTIAVNDEFMSKGEKREETLYLKCSMFGKRAEALDNWLVKGRPVMVEGKMRCRGVDSTKHPGEKVYFWDLFVDDFMFVPRWNGQRREKVPPPAAKPVAVQPGTSRLPVEGQVPQAPMPITAPKEQVEAERLAKGLPIAGPDTMDDIPF